MTGSNEKDIIDEAEIINDDTSTPVQKKKSRLKLHFIFILLLGVGTWAFWTYSPLAQQLKTQWFQVFNQNPHANNELSVAIQAPEPVTPEVEPEVEETSPDTPIFKPSPNLSLTLDTELTPEPVQTENTTELTVAVQELQQQVIIMQQNMNNLHIQQQEQAKQYVRAQLFTILRQASSASSTLNDMATAWKSITFLPLISDDKRDLAQQSYDDLQVLLDEKEAATVAIDSLITKLASQLKPSDLAEVSETVDHLVDSYQNTDIFYSWWDWLKEQFVISKVDEHAVTIAEDPYADLKQLMTDLYHVKQAILSDQWQSITNLNALFYQLEQRGLETTLTYETMSKFKQAKQIWQAQARTWMEQL